MKGANEFHFNQATMVLAMQHYLEKIMQAPVPKVTHVKEVSAGSYAECFVIKTTVEEEG
jgi:hypothetical protein